MEEGAIIKVAFPQSDGQIKFRPAILIKKVLPFNDFLVCAISTQIQNYVNDLDILIETKDSDFRQSNLKQTSIIRAAKMFTIPSKSVEGAIGKISNERYQLLLMQLRNFLN